MFLSQVASFLGVGEHSDVKSELFCTVWVTLPFPSITATIPFGTIIERLSSGAPHN